MAEVDRINIYIYFIRFRTYLFNWIDIARLDSIYMNKKVLLTNEKTLFRGYVV